MVFSSILVLRNYGKVDQPGASSLTALLGLETDIFLEDLSLWESHRYTMTDGE